MIELIDPKEWLSLPCMARTDEPVPNPEFTRMLGVRLENRIVGTLSLQRSLCLSHFYVDKEYRGNGVAEKLAVEARRYGQSGIQGLMVTTNPFVERLAVSLGMTPIEGQLWRYQGGSGVK